MKRHTVREPTSPDHRKETTFLNPDLSRLAATRSDRELIELLRHGASAIVDSIDDAIIAKTLDDVIVGWNRAAGRIYGYSAREIIGIPESILRPPELHDETCQIMEKVKSGSKVAHYETVRVKKDTSRIDVTIDISPFLDDRGQVRGALTISRDITNQKKAVESMRRLATRDALTGLANYRFLLEAFDAELRRSDRTARPFAVLLLDVDRLKEINDTHGHLVGSRVLRRLGAILKRESRSIDTAARYGGDEFAVLLVETVASAASHVARRITSALSKESEFPSFTVSLGVAVYPEDGYTVENLLAAADRGLYKNKLRSALHLKKGRSEMTNQDSLPTESGPERRRSERLLLDVPLVIRGESTGREAFREETYTISVSAHGALVILGARLELGQTVFMVNPQTQREIEGRVVRLGSTYGGLAQVGVEFAKPAPGFWPVESVPASWGSLSA